MGNVILTHDAGVEAFDQASGVVDSDDGDVNFSWDEQHIVRVDAPADLEGAFDTNKFYKIADATIARPIKQKYRVGDSIKTYKKPAEELRKAAWSFDNSPYTIDHPSTGMVKDVDDVNGFWRGVRYNDDEDRLKGNLYVPVTNNEALNYIEENQDVSVGFYNRVYTEYDGNTGDLTDDDVDGFQVDIFGNHVAGVERGRCPSEKGCGLDSANYGNIVMQTSEEPQITSQSTANNDDANHLSDSETEQQPTEADTDATTVFEGEQNMKHNYTEGDMVRWVADARVAHNPDDESGVMIEIMDRSGDTTEMVTTVNPERLRMAQAMDAEGETPRGIYEASDGTWFAVAPDEHPDDNTNHVDDAKFNVNTCSDVGDAWNLRGSGNINISEATLENRIMRVAEMMNCNMPDTAEEQMDGETDTTNETEDNNNNMSEEFNIPDLSVDALADKHEAVGTLVEQNDSLESTIDEIEQVFDEAEHISLEEGECVCDAVDDLVAELDQKAAEVEDLTDELKEYRADEIDEKLDDLTDLGAKRDEWEDESLDTIEEEIQRREEVLDAAPNTSVKDVDDGGKEPESSTDSTSSGTRTFGRGYGA